MSYVVQLIINSTLTRVASSNSFVNLILLAIMAVACAVVDSILERKGYNNHAPWEYGANRSDDNPNVNGGFTFGNALITFQNVVPISLYISIEFVRTCQAIFIYFDKDIWYEKTDQPTLARSWNLSDDLGQIEYVFSDKTGTLTQNAMVFRQCSIGGKIYKGDSAENEPVDVDEAAQQDTVAPAKETQTGSSDETTTPQTAPKISPHIRFHDDTLENDLLHGDSQEHSRTLHGFFATLSLCHTVLASYDTDTGMITYKAQSPDEAALVQAAADVGFIFRGREREILRLQTPFLDHLEEYELLNILDFTSARKRMSVIVRKLEEGDGRIFLLCKGADNVIFDRLKQSSGNEQLKTKTGEDLDYFASEGLRTLCLAYKVIPGELHLTHVFLHLLIFAQRRNTMPGLIGIMRLPLLWKIATTKLRPFQTTLNKICVFLVRLLSKISCRTAFRKLLRISSALASRSGSPLETSWKLPSVRD